MPHVVIRGPVDLAAWARDWSGILERRGGDVLKAERLLLSPDARTALVEALVVESRRKLSFYVKVSCHDRGSTTVRVDPLTNVARGDGVKRIVAAVGAELLARTPGAEVDATNVVIPSTDAHRR